MIFAGSWALSARPTYRVSTCCQNWLFPLAPYFLIYYLWQVLQTICFHLQKVAAIEDSIWMCLHHHDLNGWTRFNESCILGLRYLRVTFTSEDQHGRGGRLSALLHARWGGKGTVIITIILIIILNLLMLLTEQLYTSKSPIDTPWPRRLRCVWCKWFIPFWWGQGGSLTLPIVSSHHIPIKIRFT